MKTIINFIKNKLKIIILLSIVFVLLLVLLISAYNINNVNYYGGAFYVSFIPLLGSLILLFKKPNILDNLYSVKNRKRILLSTVFTILFILMLSFDELIKCNIFNKDMISITMPLLFAKVAVLYMKTIFIPSIIISTFICNYFLFTYKSDDSAQSKFKKLTFKNYFKSARFKMLLPIIFLTLIYMLSTYPGVFDIDFMITWNLGVIKSWDDWFPVSFTYFVNFIRLLANTPYLIIIIQSFMWIYIIDYALSVYQKFIIKRKIEVIYIILTIFFIVSFDQLQILWKEIIFSISFFGFCISILDYILSKDKTKRNYIIMIITSIIISLFRHAAIIPVVITLLVLVFYEFYRKDNKQFKIMIGILLSPIVSYGLIVVLLSHIIFNSSQSPKYFNYTIPLYQIGAIVNSDVKISDNEVSIIEEVMPLVKWKEFFRKYDGDALARGWRIGEVYAENLNKIEVSKLIKVNIAFLIKHPILYMNAYFDITNILWEMGTPNDSSVYYFKPLSETTWYTGEYDRYGITSKETILTPVTKKISKIFLENDVINQIQIRGGFAMYLLVLSTAILIYKKRKTVIIAFLPLLLYCATLFISIPASYSRYIFQFIPASIFFLLYSLFVTNLHEDY